METTNPIANQIIEFTDLAANATSQGAFQLHCATVQSIFRTAESAGADTADVWEAWSRFLDIEYRLLIWGQWAA